MIKYVIYDGKHMLSMEVDGLPYADMESILSHIIPGAWPDYLQVLNSSNDLVSDMNIKYIDGMHLIPVHMVSSWLYSFSLRKMSDSYYNRFRIFRRDIEKVYRVAWALPVSDIIVTRVVDNTGVTDSSNASIYDLANIFASFGVPDDQITNACDEGEVYGPLHYLEYIASGTECGKRGSLLCEQIQYIEDMPNGEYVFDHINTILMQGVPSMGDYLDEYLDAMNAFISSIASQHVGEY